MAIPVPGQPPVKQPVDPNADPATPPVGARYYGGTTGGNPAAMGPFGSYAGGADMSLPPINMGPQSYTFEKPGAPAAGAPFASTGTSGFGFGEDPATAANREAQLAQNTPGYKLGQYQVGQALRPPLQKGTDAGTVLKGLQQASGLNLLGGFGFGAGGGVPNVPNIPPPDTSAAQAGIFARAKDKTGQVAASALRGLQDSLAGRGMLGGGLERQGTEQLAEAGQGELGQTVRDQAIQEAERQREQAQLGYTGGIAQRGQTIQEQQMALERALRAQQGLLQFVNTSGLLY